jgi:HK97 family phage major capsid protein
MKFADLIAAAERELAAAEAKRAGLVTEQNTLLDGKDERSSLSETENARFKELSAQKAGVDTEITTARAKLDELKAEERADAEATQRANESKPGAGAPAVVVNEARTYTLETARRGVSFFTDAYRSQFKNDFAASERLQRHAAEVTVERESRAVGTGNVGGLVIPQYLTELLVMPTRKGRVTANQATNLELPAEGQVLQIPRWQSSVTATSQNGENTTVSNTDIVGDTDLLINVRTIAGEQDVSRQLVERGAPGVDQLIYADLVEAYHAQLGNQVVNADGTAGTHLGILATAGIPHATAFAAALTAALFYKKVAGAIATVASGQRAANEPPLEANVILMHPRRWGWLTSLTDNDGRPLVNTKYNGPTNVQGLNLNPGRQSLADTEGSGDTVVGQIHGVPVLTDANIPTNVGTNNEDVVLVGDKSKLLLWEDGDGAPRELQFDQTNASKLQIKLQVYGYSAFTAARRPGAVAIIGGADTSAGNGLITPSLF